MACRSCRSTGGLLLRASELEHALSRELEPALGRDRAVAQREAVALPRPGVVLGTQRGRNRVAAARADLDLRPLLRDAVVGAVRLAHEVARRRVADPRVAECELDRELRGNRPCRAAREVLGALARPLAGELLGERGDF